MTPLPILERFEVDLGVFAPLLDEVRAADKAVGEAVSEMGVAVADHLTTYREQVRGLAGEQISKQEAIVLEQRALEIEIAFTGDALRESISNLVESPDSAPWTEGPRDAPRVVQSLPERTGMLIGALVLGILLGGIGGLLLRRGG